MKLRCRLSAAGGPRGPGRTRVSQSKKIRELGHANAQIARRDFLKELPFRRRWLASMVAPNSIGWQLACVRGGGRAVFAQEQQVPATTSFFLPDENG